MAEITLNLTLFDSSSHSFEQFLALLASEQGNYGATLSETDRVILPFQRLIFEETLLSVDFPSLDKHGTNTGPLPSAAVRNEVHLVLKWLQESKGVKKLIKLTVSDSKINPHPEEAMEAAIKHLDVEHLDWRRLDLSIDTILEAAENVRELHLYSSGSRAVIGHWLGEDGVRRLSKASYP